MATLVRSMNPLSPKNTDNLTVICMLCLQEVDKNEAEEMKNGYVGTDCERYYTPDTLLSDED